MSPMPKTYDLVVPLGFACSCSQTLRQAGLQLASFPWDWVGTPPPIFRCRTICSDFKDWMNLEDLKWAGRNDTYGHEEVRNVRTGLIIMHDFVQGVSIEEQYPAITEKYTRRIARLDRLLKSSKSVLLVTIDTPVSPAPVSPEEGRKSIEIMSEKYPNAKFDFLIVNLETGRSLENRIDETPLPEVRRIAFDFKCYAPDAPVFGIEVKMIADFLKGEYAVRDYRSREEIAAHRAKRKGKHAKKLQRKMDAIGAKTKTQYYLLRLRNALRSIFPKRSDLIVVHVDGGICSQINFVSYGLAVAKLLGGKARVKYDISWFREDGKDINGRFARNWDFPKAFPDLPIEVATDEETSAAKKSRFVDLTEVSSLGEIEPSAYLGGFPKGCFNLPGLRELLREKFRPALDERSSAVAAEMESRPSCAVHVRRGDLCISSVAYGVPCTAEYFAKTIKIVRALEPDAKFYFFSDEPDYVRDTLLPALPQGIESMVVDFNGSDRGYMDLALIAKCGYVIGSIGSLGIYGAFLGGGTLVTPKYSLGGLQAIDHVIYLNDDRDLIALRQRQEDRKRVFPGVERVRWGKKRSLVLFNRIRIDYR